MTKVPVSVVVITKNEERNMHDCLKSVVDWADEIVIVDDESSDKTVEIAKSYGANIYHRKMDNEGIHRNWAYSKARNEWVLSLDADEKVSPELAAEIMATLPGTRFVAFDMPLKNYIGTYWVRHSGWYPAGKLRMFQKSKFKYEEVGVHPRVFVQGDTGHFTKDIIHKGYPDFEHFLQSLNRQTTLEAEKWIVTGRKMPLGKAVWRAVDRFFRVLIGKKGYKDGFIGFMIAFYAFLYEVMSYAKYWERQKGIREA
jgi:glycosyltransferase involved in cell wall biosynthesis